MKCLIIDAVHSSIAQELGKYMQVDTKMLPTQEELAAALGVTTQAVSQWESGICCPDLQLLPALAGLMKIGSPSVSFACSYTLR